MKLLTITFLTIFYSLPSGASAKSFDCNFSDSFKPKYFSKEIVDPFKFNFKIPGAVSIRVQLVDPQVSELRWLGTLSVTTESEFDDAKVETRHDSLFDKAGNIQTRISIVLYRPVLLAQPNRSKLAAEVLLTCGFK
jgi:hypothetical protein